MIHFDVAKSCHAMLRVYNIQGAVVTTLFNEEMKPGRYNIIFEANGLASGIYFYHIQMGEFQAIKKMILIE